MEDLLTRPGLRPPEAPAPPGRGPSASPVGRGPGSRSLQRLSENVEDGWGRVSAWEHFDALLLVLVAALALGLRWRTLWASYWGDEAIAIGIALHPVGSLPHYLANDGFLPLLPHTPFLDGAVRAVRTGHPCAVDGGRPAGHTRRLVVRREALR